MPLEFIPKEQGPELVVESDVARTQPKPKAPTTGEIYGAAFRTENTVGSWLNDSTSGYGRKFDPSFDPYDSEYLKGYEQYASRFEGAKNRQHGDAIKEQIQKEIDDRKILSDGDGVTTFFANAAAGVLDPITVAMAFVSPTSLVGKTALGTAGRYATLGAVDQMTREAVLQNTQETRPIESSAINVGAASLILGGLGPLLGKLSPSTRSVVENDVNDILKPTTSVGKTSGDAGAAKVRNTTLADEKLPVIESLMTNPAAQHTPNIRLATSPSVEVRRTHQQLADNTFRTAKNEQGLPTPIAAENTIKRQFDEIYGTVVAAIRQNAKNFRKSNNVDGVALAAELKRAGAVIDESDVIGNPSKYIKDGYFNILVSGAMRNGDKSVISEVQSTAQLIRNKALDPLKDAALERGLFDDLIEAAGRKAAAHAQANSPVAKTVTQLSDQLTTAQLEKRAAHLLRLKDRLFEMKERGVGQSKGAVRLEKAIVDAEGKLANHGDVVARINKEFADRMKASTTNMRDVTFRTKFSNEIFEGRKTGSVNLRGQLTKAKEGLRNFVEQARNDAIANATALRSATSSSYLHRVWNLDEIASRSTEFQKRIEDWVRRIAPDHEDPQGVAEDVFDTILRNKDIGSYINTEFGIKAGPLKERLLLIPDNEIADFLDNNIEHVISKYTKSMINDVVFHDTFGGRNLENQINAIRNDYKALRKAVEADSTLTPAQKAAKNAELIKREAEDIGDGKNIGDIQYLVKAIRGESDSDINMWTRTLAATKKLNAARSLGGMMLAAIPDGGRLVGANGFGRFGRAVTNFATSSEFRKMTAEEAKRIGHGYEMLLNTRLQGIGDFMMENSSQGKTAVENGIDYVTSKMGLLSGMSYWNNTAKNLAGVLHSDRMAEAMMKYGTLGKDDITYLAQHGIDKDMAGRIADQFKKYGSVVDDFHFSSVEKWDDEIAKHAYADAVYKLVNHTINTPNAGTIPRWFRENKIGGTIAQFKSFLLAFQEQTLLAGMQEHNAKALSGMVTMLGLGAVAYNAKQLAKGKEMETDPTKLLIAALDTSGLGGIPWEVNNVVNSMGPNSPSVQHMLGIDNTKRFRQVNTVEAIAGPTGGAINDLGSVIADTANGDFRQKDVHAIRRLMPYQNLFYIRQLIDKGEESFNATFGVKK